MILDRQWCIEELGRIVVGPALDIKNIFDSYKSSFLETNPLQIQRWSQRLCQLLVRAIARPEDVNQRQFESELLTAVRSLLEPAEVAQLTDSRSR